MNTLGITLIIVAMVLGFFALLCDTYGASKTHLSFGWWIVQQIAWAFSRAGNWLQKKVPNK